MLVDTFWKSCLLFLPVIASMYCIFVPLGHGVIILFGTVPKSFGTVPKNGKKSFERPNRDCLLSHESCYSEHALWRLSTLLRNSEVCAKFYSCF